MNQPAHILPDLNGANAPYWRGAQEHKVVVQACSDCGRLRFPRANLCPACSSSASTWKAIRPTGRVRSWCRFHRAYFPELKNDLPYTVLLVRMDDGVDLYSNFESGSASDVPVIGQGVEASFEAVTPEVTLVRFLAVPSIAVNAGERT
ncbi:OB-fold domain-containing protein [soil metagenome]